MNDQQSKSVRHDWTPEEVIALFKLPFNDLMFQAQTVHRQNFNANEVQISTLLSIKTGACPEDCKYCPQSGHYNTGLEKEKLMEIQQVIEEAKAARDKGASRFCMGAAWRSPTVKQMPYVVDMIKQVRALGMETCMTLGMLDSEQAQQLADAGLNFYNHNLDTSPEYYKKIISTRTFENRLDTLQNVRNSGMNVCCGGIVGMGETLRDRAGLMVELANLSHHPESVPINMLVKVPGTPMEEIEEIESFDFIRSVAVARIMMPQSHVRLSAGREEMNKEMQSLCFLAGANSIFYGEKLLTTTNPETDADQQLFNTLGIRPEQRNQAESGDAQQVALMNAIQQQRNDAFFYDAGKKVNTVHAH